MLSITKYNYNKHKQKRERIESFLIEIESIKRSKNDDTSLNKIPLRLLNFSSVNFVPEVLTSLTMNIQTILFIFILRMKFTVAPNKFGIQQSLTDDSFILSEILTNFLLKYFSDEQIFISIIVSPSQVSHSLFQSDFFENLFDEPALSEFPYNILEQLDESVDDHRNAFNLILIDNHEMLK